MSVAKIFRSRKNSRLTLKPNMPAAISDIAVRTQPHSLLSFLSQSHENDFGVELFPSFFFLSHLPLLFFFSYNTKRPTARSWPGSRSIKRSLSTHTHTHALNDFFFYSPAMPHTTTNLLFSFSVDDGSNISGGLSGGGTHHPCKACPTVFTTRAALRRHLGEIHGQGASGTCVCDQCGKLFQTKSNLKIHLLTHSGVKPFK